MVLLRDFKKDERQVKESKSRSAVQFITFNTGLTQRTGFSRVEIPTD
jgi:hypothetical protein